MFLSGVNSADSRTDLARETQGSRAEPEGLCQIEGMSKAVLGNEAMRSALRARPAAQKRSQAQTTTSGLPPSPSRPFTETISPIKSWVCLQRLPCQRASVKGFV